MPYVIPQVLVFQDFRVVPTAQVNPLRAHVSGGHAKLVRFAEIGERAEGKLGYYDRLLDATYDWPHRPVGGVVDHTYTKVWLKDAVLQYFTKSASSLDVQRVAGYANRIRSQSINFIENGLYLRDDVLLDRDVQVGDVVKVRGLGTDSVVYTLWTYVRDIIGDEVAAVVDAAVADDDNHITQSASHVITKISGAHNCVTATASHTAYDGLTSGYLDETYDIIITEGSVNQDYTVARARVISGSGTDDQADISISAQGSPTDIGTRGLTVTFNETPSGGCSMSAGDEDVSPDDLIPGQRWRVAVHAAFTAPVATAAGTYDSAESTTYIIEVTKGGLYAANPEITCTTVNGVDVSGPTKVTAASTAVAVGHHGVTVAFNHTGLRKGDRYYIEVIGSADGPMRTLVLGHTLDPHIANSTDLDVALFIKKPELQLPEDRTGFAPLVNWEVSDTQITVKSGAVAYDATWTNGGVPVALDIYSESTQGYGELFTENRFWLSDLCAEVNGITDVGDLDTLIPGVLHPDNPLKWGVFKALQNSNGAEVKFTSVCNPADDSSWADVLEKLVGRDDVYGLVPLTDDRTVQGLFEAHVTAMSSAENALWRVAWFSLVGVPEIPVIHAGSTVVNHLTATTSDGAVALATIGDDPNTAGTQYTLLRNSNANAKFLINDVAPGDVVRAIYTTDGFGNVLYQEFVVDAVLAEDQLRLVVGPAAAINVAAKFEVWRNLSATQESDEIKAQAATWGTRRVRAVWPNSAEDGTAVFAGYHVAAALAGLRSGVLPHQGLTQVAVSGITAVPQTDKFNKTQLDNMAAGGVWIVSQDRVSKAIFNRHALTTGDQADLNQKEEMITANVDSISYRFKAHFAPFIGKTNVTDQTVLDISHEAGALVSVLRTERSTPSLGGQLIDATIDDVHQHVTLKDRIVMVITLTVPYALNNLEIHLVV